MLTKHAPLVICRTLLVSKTGLEQAKQSIMEYKQGQIKQMNPELWKAKKVVDSTLHPGQLLSPGQCNTSPCFCPLTNRSHKDTGMPVFLPFRMSCFVLSNLVVTAGMLTPGLGV